MKKQRFLSLIVLSFMVIFLFVSCVVPSPKIDFPTPSNNTQIFSDRVTLFWDHFTYFESFDILFGESAETLEKLDTVSGNHFTVEDLEWGKRYFWKVVGYKTEKNTIESAVWSFTVGNPHKALLIGITDYDTASDLQLTDDDAFDMKIALQATQFDYDINLLTNRVVKSDIEAALANHQNMNEGSVFTFTYAGHGGYGNGESYLYLSDGYRLYMSELRTMLQQVPGKKLVIIDACNSGNFTELLSGRELEMAIKKVNDQFNTSVINAFAHTARNGEEAFYVMTGANIYQSSWENSTLRNGVFSFFLLDGIGDVGVDNPLEVFDFTFDADGNEDGQVTLAEAYAYAAPKVEAFVKDLNGAHQSIQVYPQDSDFIVSQW